MALVDPGEELVVRVGSAILTLASTLGPSVAIELLARRAWTYVPLLRQRSRASSDLQDAMDALRGVSRRQERASRRVADWPHAASRIGAAYDLAYSEGQVLKERSS